MHWRCMFLIVISCIPLTLGEDVDTRQRLSGDKLSRYQSHIPPTPTKTVFMEITIDFTFTYILELNGNEQSLITLGWMDVTWVDDRLAWNHSVYNVSKTYYRQTDVWLPDLYLKNSVVEVKAMKTEDMHVKVSRNGSVHWRASNIFRTKCRMDITLFPFDTQVCNLTISLWTFDDAILRIEHNRVLLANQEMNELWAIQSISKHSNGMSEVNVVVTLNRCCAYYISNLLLPVEAVVGLISVVFALPVGQGDRVSLTVTILLSLVLFLTMLNEHLPKTSTHTSVFTIYIDLYLFYSSLSVALSIVSLRVASFPPSKPIPDYLKRIMRPSISLCSRKKIGVDADAKLNANAAKVDAIEMIAENSIVRGRIETIQDDLSGIRCPTWMDAARALNRVFLITFLVLISVTNLIVAMLLYVLPEHGITFSC